MPNPSDPSTDTDDTSSEPPSHGILTSRRSWMMGTGIVLATVGLGFSSRDSHRAILADIGCGELADLQEDLANHRAEFAAQYAPEGTIPHGPAGANELLVEAEWVEYLRQESNQEALSLSQFRSKHLDPFIEGVRGLVEDYSQSNDPNDPTNPDTQLYGTPTIAAMVNLKFAIDEQMGDGTHYSAKHNLVIDPILHPDRQCRSGTKLFMLQALEEISPKLLAGERLVEVYTNHHVQPGLLTADNRLFTIEMTKLGRALRDYGLMDEVDTKLEVVDAAHSMAQSALGQSLHRDKAMIFSNLTPEDRLGNVGFNLPDMRPNGDQYGFASHTIEIPTERIPMGEMMSVPAVSGTPNDVYDSITETDQSRELLQGLSAQERAIYRDYSQHMNYIDRAWSRQAEILDPILANPKGLTEEEVIQRVNKMNDLSREFVEYCNANDVDTKYHRTKQMLKGHGIALVQKGPFGIAKAFEQNTSVAIERWARAITEDQ